METVLELINSYETKISTVEDLIATAYQATVVSQESQGAADDERERLILSLQRLLAKNCSLRKKDSKHLLGTILSNANHKRKDIQEKQNQIRLEVKEYLNEQKELANRLREQLFQVIQENLEGNYLQEILLEIKELSQNKGQDVFTMLRGYQRQLEDFQKEQDGINRRLQRLVDRGESLKIEDLRQLNAARARRERITLRETRRGQVERLITKFRQQRQYQRINVNQ
ncbi:MAG: hypothetical protein HY662_01355 [Chloroflexi bacterium]|nr:hypothetical protein [Chloroflexota bacterium]